MNTLPLIKVHAKIIKQSRDIYDKLSNAIISNLEDDNEKAEKLREVAKLLEQSVKNEHLINKAKRAVQPIQDQINNNDEDDIEIAKIKEEFNTAVNSFRNESTLENIYKSDADIKKIQKLIQEVEGTIKADIKEDVDEDDLEDEDDITTTQQELNLVDPISKKLMESPYRHTPCGHVYDKETILMMIKQKRKKGFRCPYMGCQYRKPINPDDLEEALDYKREIARRKRAGRYQNS